MQCILFKNDMVFIPRLRALTRRDNSDVDFGDRHFVQRFINIGMSKEDINKICNSIVDIRKEKFQPFGNQLAIVPTTECHGRCTYCYAKEMREHNSGYIKPETLKKSLDIIFSKNGGQQIQEVIVYGGDPGVDTDGLRGMLSCFPNDTYICLVTGLLYSDELYEGLKSVLKEFPNVSCCLSIDPLREDGKYNRVYDFKNGKTTYKTLVERAAELLNLNINRIAVRPTITADAFRFDVLRKDILAAANLRDGLFQFTVELIDHEELPVDVMEYLKDNLTYLWDQEVPVSPAKRFIHDVSDRGYLLNMYGDCDQLFGRITVGPYGEFHGCPNSPVQQNQFKVDNQNDFINSTNEELKELRTRLWDKCLECDFVEYCSGFCYIVAPTDSRCDWRCFNICEGIYQSMKNKTPEELDLLSKSSLDEHFRLA